MFDEFGDALSMHVSDAACANDAYLDHVNSAFLKQDELHKMMGLLFVHIDYLRLLL